MATKDGLRYEPLYTPTDISRYVHVASETLRDWSSGNGKALIKRADDESVAPFSFINLIEAHVLVAMRKMHKIPMQRIRPAVRWLRRHFKTTHPLAEINLETDGRDLFVKHLGLTVSASEGGQIGIPDVIRLYLRRIDRDQEGPARFYPFTTNPTCPKLIVMDPQVDFGRPVIEGTRIETVMIFDRYSGGEGLTELAKDYDVELPKIEEALRCEIERRAA